MFERLRAEFGMPLEPIDVVDFGIWKDGENLSLVTLAPTSCALLMVDRLWQTRVALGTSIWRAWCCDVEKDL